MKSNKDEFVWGRSVNFDFVLDFDFVFGVKVEFGAEVEAIGDIGGKSECFKATWFSKAPA